MSYQRERDYFMAQVAPTLGVPNARALLACATTLQRLAEARCNGDWPCDNGERKVVACPLCEGLWVPSQIQGGKFAILASVQCADDMTSPPKNRRETPPWHRTAKACPDCRAKARAHQLVEDSPYQAVTQGDLRDARGLRRDNGERKVVPCPLCDSLWVPSQIQGGKLAELAHRMAGGRCACGPCLRCPTDASNLSPAACLCEHAAPRACPDCRTEARAHSLVEDSPYQVITQGDPRGAVLSLYERSASRESIENGTARRIYVPTR